MAGFGCVQGSILCMSASAQTLKDPPGHDAGLRLAVIGGVTVLFSVAAFAAGLLGAMPRGISTAIVMLGMGVALKLTWMYVARSATSANRARISTIMSNLGLAISAIALIAALPRLTKTSGVGLLLIDSCAQLWTLAILTAAAGPARTLGWRPFAGAFLTGFLGLTGLARFVGRPSLDPAVGGGHRLRHLDRVARGRERHSAS